METNSFFSLQISLDANSDEVQGAVNKLLAAFGIGTPQITPAQIAADTSTTAPATSTTAPVTSTTAPAGELDKDGVPWDARIHAGTKTKTAKGLWTRKKGIDDDTYNAITASLKGATSPAGPVQTTPPAGPVQTTTPALTLTTPTLSLPTLAPLAGYSLLVDFLAKNSGDGKLLTQDYVNQTFAGNNTSLAALAGNDAAADAFLAAFRNVLSEHNVAEVK